ncbi:PhzF family phenazine biosynthesis protein [Methylovirgula sp. HY1]|uniref:PhzF family phenazine biosynthesis protein n=1 Tax=Methylovirgula sp. HY1 TaxID=2822761 RepID=UPI001C5B238F|nr:PhzF family phenazine biosynthesis protein [Methylovirgula sp. HY1]QXX74470.1 Trans-2,3-dihydro-3-hydroxyanthranilate isomerase [Methylovirgula sp. HY1]
MRRKYYVLDVFSDRALSGNPLAAMVDCDGLETEAMQKIAAEFNLSETIFILAPRDPVNTARLRIFTPQAELPFAGHPTVGGAILVAELRAAALLRAQDLRVVLEENIGTITCTVSHRPNSARRAHFIMPKLPARIGLPQDKDRLAAALGLNAAEIGFDRHVPTVYSAGLPFTFVPIINRAALARAKPRLDLFDLAFGSGAPGAAYLYTRETVDEAHDFHARMFAPSWGVSEDPATGAAAAAFTGVLMAFEKVPDGSHALAIEQGYELGRPSLITLTLDVEQSVLVEASIGGAAVIVAEGTLDL